MAATSLLALLSSSGAGAACLLSDYSVRAEFDRSHYVARVHVDRETWLDEHFLPTKLKPPLHFGAMPSGLDPYPGVNYRVTLEERFKGHLPARFDIYSENTTGRFPLRVGQDYLVFLEREPSSDAYVRAGALTADNCGNSGLWDQKRPIIAEIRRLGRKAGRVRAP